MIFIPTDRNQDVRVSDDMPLGTRGGTSPATSSADGEYQFEMTEGERRRGQFGITAEPHQQVGIDGVSMVGARSAGRS
jgi:hypothetical protein